MKERCPLARFLTWRNCFRCKSWPCLAIHYDFNMSIKMKTIILTQTAQRKVSFPQRSIVVMTWNKPVPLFRCHMSHKSQSIHLTVNFKSHLFDARAWFKLFLHQKPMLRHLWIDLTFQHCMLKKSCTFQFTIEFYSFFKSWSWVTLVHDNNDVDLIDLFHFGLSL